MNEVPLLQVRELTTKLKLGRQLYTVVDHLSFDLYKGKTLALVGESGSGKTLTALSIMGILPLPPFIQPQGKIFYQGHNLLEIGEKKRRELRGAKIAMIFQNPSSALNPVYTIGYQLMEVAELHLKLVGEEAFERCVKALTEVGISFPEKRMENYPHQLSGGMKQRVMIAMALMAEPDILIADEPTTALDVTIQAQVIQLMKNLQIKKQMAILLITHDMGVVAEMADDVVVMYAAQRVESGNVFQIFQSSQIGASHAGHPYTEGLFNSRAAIKAHREKLNTIKGSIPPITHFPEGCHFHPRCPYAMEICKNGRVPYFQVGQESQHQAKCWLFDQNLEVK